MLTVRIAATGGEIRLTGVLRSYYSMASLHGWALVPPQQHGGWAAQRLTALDAIADAMQREVVLTGRGRMLRRDRFRARARRHRVHAAAAHRARRAVSVRRRPPAAQRGAVDAAVGADRRSRACGLHRSRCCS
jgi:hypothetical protein